MSVVGAKANIADQRSSKSAVGSLFASTGRPFNKVVPSVQGKCDLMAAPVAATVSRATATNPVIVRCFVIRTSSSSKPTRVGHGNFAKVQQRRDKVWTAPEQKAVTSAVGHRTDMPTILSDVRCWVNSGKHLLAASISPFDPLRTSGPPNILCSIRSDVFQVPGLDGYNLPKNNIWRWACSGVISSD